MLIEKRDSNDEDKFTEILIVSHGSFMRQVFKFFVFELKCDFPFSHSCMNTFKETILKQTLKL